MDIKALARGFTCEATAVQVGPSIFSPTLTDLGKELARGDRGRILCIAIEVQHEILNLCAGPDVEVGTECVERIVLRLRCLQCVVGTQIEVLHLLAIDVHRVIGALEGERITMTQRDGNRSQLG